MARVTSKPNGKYKMTSTFVTYSENGPITSTNDEMSQAVARSDVLLQNATRLHDI